MAVIAAGLFAVLGQSAAGAGERAVLEQSANKSSTSSNWKNASRRESLGD